MLAVAVVVLAATLLLHGYTHHMLGAGPDGEAATDRPAGSVPKSAVRGGPVIDASHGGVRTIGPGPRRIALTFDDGPDPVWTPRILDVLRDAGVHATFFVVGSQAAEHPELLRRMHDEGHEVGVHTFTHVDLAGAEPWRRWLELHNSQLVIAGATGLTSPLLRPPYSSVSDALDDRSWSAAIAAADDGYLTVLTTLDSEDWRRPGVERILADSLPQGPAGQVVLMHDGGGDRSQTVEALRGLLPRLRTEGYRVDTVSASVDLPDPATPATTGDRWQGVALIAAVQTSNAVAGLISVVLVLAGGLSLLRALGLVLVARRHSRRRRGLPPPEDRLRPATVVLPAYNERAGIEAAVRGAAASRSPVEVVVVDDGSTDGTGDLVESLALPGVRVVRQPNQGKPAALNAGIAAATHEIVVMVDGDTVLEPDAVGRLVQHFDDPRVGAVAGNAKVANRGGLLGRWQHAEYVVSFNLDRRLFDLAGCMPTVPGAIGAFRRSALRRVGGVSADTLAEDTDLTMALCRDGWRVTYEEDARAWTEVPQTLRALWRQRYRWCYGTLQSMWKHRSAVLERGPAGRFGRRGLGYLLVFQILLPLAAPVIDVSAVYGLVFLDAGLVAVMWLAFAALQMAVGLYAFRLDHERPGPLLSLPLQQLVYRQLMYLVVLQSVGTALLGARLPWQHVERYGSLRLPPDPGGPAADADRTVARL